MLQLNINHVFTFEGKAINGVKSSFRTAVKNAGIEDFHFHYKKKAVNLLNGLTAKSSVSQKCHKNRADEKQQSLTC